MKRYEGVIWSQGYFVDQRQYRNWTQEQKAEADYREKRLVRPSPTGNAICQCNATEDAKWIAEQLNKVSDVEALKAERDRYREALEHLYTYHKAMESHEVDRFLLQTLDGNALATTTAAPEKEK
jgi:NAD-dependent oxidoreductase involved in siderophore biosynthesis